MAMSAVRNIEIIVLDLEEFGSRWTYLICNNQFLGMYTVARL